MLVFEVDGFVWKNVTSPGFCLAAKSQAALARARARFRSALVALLAISPVQEKFAAQPLRMSSLLMEFC
jgi:hypothetical protein